MKRAILQQEVSRQAWKDSSFVAPPPVDPVYVYGPRGGRYLAIGPWTRLVDDTGGDRWDRNVVTVIDRSMSVRYIRPRHHAIPLTDPPHGD